MPNGFETLLFAKRDALAFITLNRPHAINAYNLRMRDELWQALEAVRDDPDVRAVVLAGAGERGFCAGADLTEFGSAPSQAVARRVRFERDVWELWLSIRKPFVAALHGYVLGSGLEMALLCDVRIAAEGAVFGLPEVSLGIMPAAGGTQTFPRQAGVAAGLEALLTARRYSAREALRLGQVHAVVTRARLAARAERVAAQLARLAPETVGLAKEALQRGADLPLSQALALEERLAVEALLGRWSGLARSTRTAKG
ncbi:MAG: enoyl-CoA hydratase/isomerase family protein [Dehalococcoidia bacterium]|nr:enoyl-CoA hydratase/isomerase family protein [Dehalococcoidia bacterium]